MQQFLLIVFMLFFIDYTFASGDALKGKSKAIICFGCHGTDGNSSNSDYPILAGQGAGYLSKQLLDFKSGVRKEQHMTSMVEAISKSDIPHIVAYFSQQKRQENIKSKSNLESGKNIYQNGIPSKMITACVSCHGVNGEGIEKLRYPLLAGQHEAYLIKILKDFRSGLRQNDTHKIMRNIAMNLSDKEIKVLSKFISTLN